MFSKFSLIVALMLAISTSARPAERRWGGWAPSGQGNFAGRDARPWWQPSKASSYLDFTKRAGESFGSCDLNTAVGAMNLGKVSPPLPEPQGTLFQVVIGRGTQNYTCDLANATATPVAVGAVASLWNVSCIAADMPALLEKLPAIALDLPLPSADDASSPIVRDLSGHHYFLDDTTPFFNLDTALHQYGMGAVAKANASDAPAGAYAGPYGRGDGAVQWLKLDANPDAPQRAWSQVYRLNTAGGVPPKTCTGLTPTFEVQYASEYWLFK